MLEAPEGSVLGPYSENLILSALHQWLNMRYDMIIYRQIDCQKDVLKLQEDLAKFIPYAGSKMH